MTTPTRTVTATLALAVLIAGAVHNIVGAPVTRMALPPTQWSIAIIGVLLFTGVGVVRGRPWGRSLGLAAGLSASFFALWSWAYKYFDLWKDFQGLNGEWALFAGPVLIAALVGRDAIDNDRWFRRAGIAGLLAGSVLAYDNAYFVRELSNPVHAVKVIATTAATLAVIVGAWLCVFRHPAKGVWLMLAGCLTTVVLLVPAFLKHDNPAALVLGTALLPVAVLAVLAAAWANRNVRKLIAGIPP